MIAQARRPDPRVQGPVAHERGLASDDLAVNGLNHACWTAGLAIGSGVDDMYQLQQVIRRVVGKWVSDTHRRRPMIIPVVVES